MSRLTQREREAVIDVLNEALAGGADDLRDALGLSERDADQMFSRVESARDKLATARRSTKKEGGSK